MPLPRSMIAGLILAALVVVGLPVAVLAVGLFLTAPARAVVGPPPASLSGAEVVALPSASGSVLRGWWVPAARPGGGAVVLLHGVYDDRRRMVRRAEVLLAAGFGVLLFDLQAEGESPGRHITFGRLEALDAAAAVAFARGRAPDQRVGAIGVSLGGAATLLGSAPLPVDALVLESVYPDIDAALGHRLRNALGPLLGAVATPILSPLFMLLLPPLIGVRPDDLRPIDRIGTVTAPVLVAAGTADRDTPLDEAQALFGRAPQPRRFWAVPGAGHVDLEAYAPDAYWREVLPFLTEHLRAAQ